MTEQDKRIQELLKGNFEESAPSLYFTDNVMAKIDAQVVLSTDSEFEYVPVISKTGWIVIGALFLTVVGLGRTNTKESEFSMGHYIPDVQFDSSVIHSQLALFVVLSVFALLMIDHVFTRFKLG